MRFALAVFVVFATVNIAAGATYVVRNTNDSGLESLRWAVESVNASPPGPHNIVFNILGGGIHTILLQSPLPEIGVPVLIDAYTQPGAQANQLAIGSDAVLLVELDGSGLTGTTTGLTLRGGGSTLRGIAIVGFTTAVRLRTADANTVSGCFIGLGADGDTSRPNEDGIATGGSFGNTVGGPAPAARNVISNNGVRGIVFDTSDNVIQGNIIGLDPTGGSVRANGSGVFFLCGGALLCNDNLVGGEAPGEGNVVSGNQFFGIGLSGTMANQTPTGNRIVGNLVGLDATGYGALPNGFDNVDINAADDTQISANTIAGGRSGIAIGIGSVGTVVQGNLLGTDIDGTPLLGFQTAGIRVISGSQQTLIGGTVPADGNLIAPSDGDGVMVVDDDTSGVSVLGNSIWGHQGLAIELTGGSAVAGPDPNDPLDADTGPNGIQNHPIITGLRTTGTNWEIDVELDSMPSTTYHVELFANSICTPSGHGEAEVLLTTLDLTTDGAGHASTLVTVPIPVSASLVTATATDPDGSTSELSPCAVAQAPASIPTVGHVGAVFLAIVIATLGWLAICNRVPRSHLFSLG